jgi:predicted Rossmann fold flavoprotein
VNAASAKSCIVVGAGAAGLVAAIFAARAGVSVVLLETRPKPGAKIRISGGGRCNVLPSRVTLDDFHGSGSIHSLRNILYSWPLEEVREFFERDLGVDLKTEASGKVFPVSDRSRDVLDALLHALERSGAQLRAGFRVGDVERSVEGWFTLRSEEGESLEADALVLATGGLSLPKTGSDGAGLRLAANLGHSLVPTYPALVPLLATEEGWAELSGVSVAVRMSAYVAGKLVEEREGDFLFTHRGFSGPVVLDMSRHVTQPGLATILRVQWGGGEPGLWDRRLREGGKRTVGSTVKRAIPERLATRLLQISGVDPALRLAELAREDRMRLVEILERFELPVSGNEGYRTAEVMGGGIPLGEVDAATLESRVAPGLYLCGEILDATGRLGGYNFLWAWVTGRKVGQALGRLA